MSASMVFVVFALEAVLVAALARSRAGARAGLIVAVLALPLPAFVAAPAFARALLGVAFFMIVVRTLDLMNESVCCSCCDLCWPSRSSGCSERR